MSVTNNIRDKVIFENGKGWREEKLTNLELINCLNNEIKKPFLSFAWGVWVTAHARKNLIDCLLKLDSHVVYS